MKGEDKHLIRFFEGADKRFIIPLYQRNYDWEIKHCLHLFLDFVAYDHHIFQASGKGY